jgi:hypothetical protein
MNNMELVNMVTKSGIDTNISLLLVAYKYRYFIFGISLCIFTCMLVYTFVYYITKLTEQINELEKQVLQQQYTVEAEINKTIKKNQNKIYNEMNDVLSGLRDEISTNITQINTNLELLHEMIHKNSTNITEVENNLKETNEKFYVNYRNIMELDEKTKYIPWGSYRNNSVHNTATHTLFADGNSITTMESFGKVCNNQSYTTFYLDSLKYFPRLHKIDICSLRNYKEVIDRTGNNMLDISPVSNTYEEYSKRNIVNYLKYIRPDIIISYAGNPVE